MSWILQGTPQYMADHPDPIATGVRIIRVAKTIERIADHATDIAEEILFVVRGDDVRHRSARHDPLWSRPWTLRLTKIPNRKRFRT